MKTCRDLLTTEEVAAELGKTRRTVQRMVKAGTLTPARTLPGGRGVHLFRREDVEALAEDPAA